MKLKFFLNLCLFLMITQNILAQKQNINFSNRVSSVDSNNISITDIKTYGEVFNSLSGLKFAQTTKTLGKIKSDFNDLKSKDNYDNKKWDLRKDALTNIFNENPAGLLSLIWPVFLIFFIVWFIIQYKKVFIQKIEF